MPISLYAYLPHSCNINRLTYFDLVNRKSNIQSQAASLDISLTVNSRIRLQIQVPQFIMKVYHQRRPMIRKRQLLHDNTHLSLEDSYAIMLSPFQDVFLENFIAQYGNICIYAQV